MTLIESRGKKPNVHLTAYVAPTAVLSGDITVGENTAILFGAVLTSEGGPITIGRNCVVMENAVIRGVRSSPVTVGDYSLVGPTAYLSGCRVGQECFVAAGSRVFNDAVLEDKSEVRVNGIVQVGARLGAGKFVPMGWIVVGDPGQLFPPEAHDELYPIQKAMQFNRTVFGVERGTPLREILSAYTKSLVKHQRDKVISE